MDSRIDTYRHIQVVQRLLARTIADLMDRQQAHDQSKLASPELEVFDEFTPKLAGSTYGSEEYKQYLAAMKPALDHHYAANSHHPEHYRPQLCKCVSEPLATDAADGIPRVTIDARHPSDFWEVQARGLVASRDCKECHGTGWVKDGIRGMSLLDVLEMLCDWKAATLRHNDGDIRRSIEINQGRFGYSDELKQILLNTLPAIEGSEDVTAGYRWKVGDRVMIDCIDGFGGPAVVTSVRESETNKFQVRMLDGNPQSPFWAHDFEVSKAT